MEILDLLNMIADDKLKQKMLILYEDVIEEFTTKPASIRGHHKWPGGMYEHVQQTMAIALELYQAHPDWYKCSTDEVLVAAFIHDFNKIGVYRRTKEDWKIRKGQLFEWDPSIIEMSDAGKATWLCAQYGIGLSAHVVNAVAFHHGGWSSECANVYSTKGQVQMTPLAHLIHYADMMSSKVFGDASTKTDQS